VAIFISRAQAADAQLVFDLIAELAEYEKLGHEVEATAARLSAALFCEHPKVFCDIAEYQGEAAGLAIWFYSFSTFRGRHGIWLEDLFVRPSFRRKGIGRALITTLARRCVEENLARLEWSVLDWNEPSIQFYKRMGARLMDEWTNGRIDGEALARLGRTEQSQA
jgi:GNAT superfamily N-acetyltransferase